MNVTNTHSSTLWNICTEENVVFSNLVALSVRLYVCLLVAICQAARIQSNHVYSNVSLMNIRGRFVLTGIKLCIQYLHIVIREILLFALPRTKNKTHEGKSKTLCYIRKRIFLQWQWEKRELPGICYKFTGPHGVTFPCDAALGTPSNKTQWLSM